MQYLKLLITSSITILLLAACGGGGSSGPSIPTYKGLTTPATISSTNSQAIATKTTVGSEEAVAQNAAKNANPFPFAVSITNNVSVNPVLIDIARQVANRTSSLVNLPAAITITATDLNAQTNSTQFCGGTVTAPDNFGSNGMFNGSMTFNSLCYEDPSIGQTIINGTLAFSQTSSNITFRYINFSMSYSGESATINMTISCDTGFACSVLADYTGTDGLIYRVADMSVSGTGTGPYAISATFYHPTYGSVLMSSTDLMYNCTNNHPSAGTINITGANGTSASITYTSCAGYTGSWNDGVNTGTFSGTW